MSKTIYLVNKIPDYAPREFREVDRRRFYYELKVRRAVERSGETLGQTKRRLRKGQTATVDGVAFKEAMEAKS